MRFCLGVAASEPTMAWSDVHGPARAVLYDLIRSQDPVLSKELHDTGWQGSPLRPVGISPPLFAGTKSRKGVYSTSGKGSIWLGSPVPRIAASILAALAGRMDLRWGAVKLAIRGVQLESLPDHSTGEAVFESVSPVIVKRESRFLLPGEAGYAETLVHNLRHKADLLGLSHDVRVEVLDSGPRRRFDVQRGIRIGANVKVQVNAAPALLDALYEWGLGLGTNQGFGWVR